MSSPLGSSSGSTIDTRLISPFTTTYVVRIEIKIWLTPDCDTNTGPKFEDCNKLLSAQIILTEADRSRGIGKGLVRWRIYICNSHLNYVLSLYIYKSTSSYTNFTTHYHLSKLYPPSHIILPSSEGPKACIVFWSLIITRAKLLRRSCIS